MKTAGFLVAVLLFVSCKNDNTPKLLKEVEARKDGEEALVVSFALVDGNDQPTTANGLLLIEIQGIAQQDTLFTMAEVDTVLSETNFRKISFGQGAMEQKKLGFASTRIPYRSLKNFDSYRKTDKKAVVNVSFKPDDGPVLSGKVGYEF